MIIRMFVRRKNDSRAMCQSYDNLSLYGSHYKYKAVVWMSCVMMGKPIPDGRHIHIEIDPGTQSNLFCNDSVILNV